jgi:ABC-2 type transport system permease protein
MLALILKEIRIHFASPIFAVTSALFLFLTGFAFTASLTQASPQQLPEASMRGMLYFMSVVLLFISPFLSMRSFSEEKKTGTIELLKTSPLSDLQIVLAKYVSLLMLLVFLLLLTVEFPILIALSGDPDPGPMVLSYVGLFLLGANFLAIGLFMSVLTGSQMIAAILTFVVTITLWFLGDMGGNIGPKISIIEHVHSFSQGVLNAADLAYYLLMIFVFLFLTHRFLEAERWK